MYKTILITTDGSDVARRGVDHGINLARSLGARVTVLTVTEPFPFHASPAGFGWVPTQADIEGYEKAQSESAKAILADAQAAAAKLGVEVETVHVADARPAETIIATARERGSSLIVMGSHGRRGIERLLLGSQTSEVLTSSHIPVLVVR